MAGDVPAGGVAPFPEARFLEFCSKLKVQSKDLGLVPFRLLETQKYILRELAAGLDEGVTTFMILKSRQIGCTTFFLALDLFWAFAHKGLLGTFILHQEQARDDWRQTIDVFYHEIPTKAEIAGEVMRFRPALLRHNRNILAFSNGSRFRYLVAGTGEHRKGGLGRSGASNYVHASECAFYGNEDDIRAFRSQLSSVYRHRLAVYESTANSFNWFYESFQSAKKSVATRTMFIGWWRDERNQFDDDHPLFKAYCPDRSMTRWERTRWNAVKREYGVEINLKQIAWYRWKLREEFDTDESTMLQEFPWTEDDAWQATGSKYFASEALGEAIKAAQRTPYKTYRYRLGSRWEETSIVGFNDQRAELRVWEDSSKFGYYVIGCDPAFGSSDTADSTVISVWRAFSDRIIQVAEFCTHQVSTYQCAWVLAHLAGFYGQVNVRVNLEITGPGAAVWQELNGLKQKMREMRPADDRFDLRNVFKNMQDYLYRKADSLNGELAFQWKMTSDLKRRIMAQFKDGLEIGERRIIPRSVPLLEECRHIVNDEGHIEAEGGHKDDRVIAAALAHEAWRMWTQPLLRARNLTYERGMAIEARGGEKPLDLMIQDFMKKQNIDAGKPARMVQPWEMGARGLLGSGRT